MTENITYICDYCGEVFENEDECRNHEWGHKWELFKNKIKFMKEENGIFVELPLSCDSVDTCSVIYCSGSDEAWEVIEEAFEYTGYYCVPRDVRADGHFFIYDYDSDSWFCLEKKMNYFTELSKKINATVNGE